MNRRSVAASAPLLVPLLLLYLAGCSREPSPEEKLADSTLTLAKDSFAKGLYRESMRLLRQAAALDRRLTRTEQLAEEYALLGHLSAAQADFDSAISFLTNAADQYKLLGKRTTARALLLEVASLHETMGQDRVALGMYTRALRLANVFNDVDAMQEIQFAMLPACRALEDADEQARAVNEVLRRYMQDASLGRQSLAYYESAVWLLHRGNHSGAIEPLLRSLTLSQQARESLLVIRALAALAYAYDRTGSANLSFETYADALRRADQTSGAQFMRLEMLIRIGTIYLRNQQPSEAARFYRAALSSAVQQRHRLAEGFLFLQLSHCALAEGKSDEAFRNAQAGLDVFTPYGYHRGIAYARFTRGLLHQKRGQFTEALEHLTLAVDESERALALPGPLDVYAECQAAGLRTPTYYDAIVELLLQLDRADEAFRFAARKNALATRTSLERLSIKSANGQVAGALAAFQRATAHRWGAENKVADLLQGRLESRQLQEDLLTRQSKLEAEWRDAAAQVARLNPRLAPAVQIFAPAIAEVQRTLPPGTLLVVPLPTTRSLYIFAITGSKATLQLAALERDHLTSLKAEFLAALKHQQTLADSPAFQQAPTEARIGELSASLYSALVRPVEALMTSSARVLIDPGPELTGLPFHALRRSGPGSRYLLEAVPVAYLATLVLRSEPATPDNPTKDVVALGHPGETSWDVEYELRDIRAFYKDARLHFGTQASLPTLLGERGDILHVALDIRFTAAHPQHGFIFLSDGKYANSAKPFALGELSAMQPFPSVIISHLAADTVSLNNLLPALFLMNGSSTVVAGMLPASRKAKKILSEVVYTALQGGGSVETAVRQAQLQLLRTPDLSAPSAWAPFFTWVR